MLRDSGSRAPRPLYQLGYVCDQPYFLIVVWTQRHSPTHLQQTRTLVTPAVRSKAGGSVPALNVPIAPGGLRATAQASTSMSNPSPAIHGLPSEPLLSV